MTIHAFVGAKGGVGTTTAAMLLARCALEEGREVVLADLSGDFSIVAGAGSDATRYGIAEWCADPQRSSESLTRSMVYKVAGAARLLPRGHADIAYGHLPALWAELGSRDCTVIVDAGRDMNIMETLDGQGAQRLLVAACDYQSINRARHLLGRGGTTRIDCFVIRSTVDAAIFVADVETAVGRSADAVIQYSRPISRWVDSGLILDRTEPLVKATMSELLHRTQAHSAEAA